MTIKKKVSLITARPPFPSIRYPVAVHKSNILEFIKKETVLFKKDFSYYDDATSSVPLLNFINGIPEAVKLEDVVVKITQDRYHKVSLLLATEVKTANPLYSKELEKHTAAKIKYDEDLAAYTDAHNKYQKELKAWNKLVKEQALLSEKKKLQDRLAKLETKLVKTSSRKKAIKEEEDE